MATTILTIDNIEVIYDKVILAVKDISLKVEAGSIVALLGANGAGKSTTLKAISGLVKAERGEVVRGNILYHGHDITRTAAAGLVQAGLVQVLEGRHCFAHLTVEENLLTGAFARKASWFHKGVSPKSIDQSLEKIYHYFPRLRKLRKHLAGYVSGGEQQMVAIGRALMAAPQLVLLDEPSMGLAPQITEDIFEIVNSLRKDEGVSFLLAEQNATVALRYADYAYIIENGSVTSEGNPETIDQLNDLQASYLGG